MADIDDELLALAGDASSDEDEVASTNISRESSGTADRKAIGKTGTKKSTKSVRRRQDDSEEEGEA